MSDSKLRIGILGAGWFVSRRHAPDLARLGDVEMVAACRRDRATLDTFCDHFNIPERYSRYEEMLDHARLDAVVVATPHASHYEHAAACLERGLHVLLEKPLALTAADGERLCTLAREQQRVLLVALNPPYWPHCHQLRTWIREGRIGNPEAVEITWINSAGALFGQEPLPEKLPGVVRPTQFRGDSTQGGGGHLMDGGQHNISELLWAMESEPVRVTASMDRLPVDLRAAVSVVLKNGALASITGITDSAIGQRRAHSDYYGSTGTIRVGVLPFSLTLERPGHEPEVLLESSMPPAPSPAEDLVRCIRTGAEPLGSPEHALATTRLIEQAYAAAGR